MIPGEHNMKRNFINKIRAGIFTFILLITIVMSQHTSAQTTVSDLPLQILPVTGAKSTLIIFLTGDGGWNRFSRELCNKISGMGYNLVALDSRKYFWKEKTPDKFTQDVSSLVKYYQGKWHINHWVLVGYSFGADVVPFFSDNLKSSASVNLPGASIMISPFSSTNFEVKLEDMIADIPSKGKYDVLSALQKTPTPTLVVYAADEAYKLPVIKNNRSLKFEELPGGHHYNEDIDSLAGHIITFIRKY